MVLKIIFSLVAGYLLGSLNGSLLIGKLFYQKDIREHGSGNAGATNMLRTLGKSATIGVVAIDFLKGILACIAGQLLAGYSESFGWAGMYLAAFGAFLGHSWPVFFGFKGGKGVLTTFSVILYMSPLSALICLALFIIIVALTRYVSLGSILGAVSWPIISVLFFDIPVLLLVTAVFMVMLIVFLHKENILRLMNGTEKKLSFSKKQ